MRASAVALAAALIAAIGNAPAVAAADPPATPDCEPQPDCQVVKDDTQPGRPLHVKHMMKRKTKKMNR